MAPPDWRAGVDFLARRPSHIPDRLQESTGGGPPRGARLSGSTSPAANHLAPAGRRSECPRVGLPRESGARSRSTEGKDDRLWPRRNAEAVVSASALRLFPGF